MGNADKKRKLGNGVDGQGAAPQQRVHHHYKPARELASSFYQSSFNQDQLNPPKRNRDYGGARGVPLNPNMIINSLNGLDANGMNSAQ